MLGHSQTALTAGTMADIRQTFKDLIASFGGGGRSGKLLIAHHVPIQLLKFIPMGISHGTSKSNPVVTVKAEERKVGASTAPLTD